jgi:hypothetical protein
VASACSASRISRTSAGAICVAMRGQLPLDLGHSLRSAARSTALPSGWSGSRPSPFARWSIRLARATRAPREAPWTPSRQVDHTSDGKSPAVSPSLHPALHAPGGIQQRSPRHSSRRQPDIAGGRVLLVAALQLADDLGSRQAGLRA